MSRGWGWRPARTRGPRGPASCSCQAWRKAGDDAHTCTPPPSPTSLTWLGSQPIAIPESWWGQKDRGCEWGQEHSGFGGRWRLMSTPPDLSSGSPAPPVPAFLPTPGTQTWLPSRGWAPGPGDVRGRVWRGSRGARTELGSLGQGSGGQVRQWVRGRLLLPMPPWPQAKLSTSPLCGSQPSAFLSPC